MSDFTYTTIWATKNPTYQYRNTSLARKGILVHSTGANNNTLRRYVQPDDGSIGVNSNGNSMNRKDCDWSVHGFVGKDKNGKVRFVQVLPFEQKVWGCGAGARGSYNSTHIQFEICEGAASDKNYALEAYEVVVELCVFLCRKYGLKASAITSHYEAHAAGYASNHGDPKSYWQQFGLSMAGLRKDVAARLEGKEAGESANGGHVQNEQLYRVRKSWSDQSSQKGAFAILANARTCADENPGYTVYDGEGKAVYTSVKNENTDGRMQYTKALQQACNTSYQAGLAVDGSCGPLTQAVINEHYLYYRSPVIKNKHVSWLQDALNHLGQKLAVDGSCGPATETAIKQFQRDHGLEADGFAGVKTHLKILSLV